MHHVEHLAGLFLSSDSSKHYSTATCRSDEPSKHPLDKFDAASVIQEAREISGASTSSENEAQPVRLAAIGDSSLTYTQEPCHNLPVEYFQGRELRAFKHAQRKPFQREKLWQGIQGPT